jgi:hypothetical protein
MFNETPDDSNQKMKDAVYYARQLRSALIGATWGIYDSDLRRDGDLAGQLRAFADVADSLSSRIEHRRRAWNRERQANHA